MILLTVNFYKMKKNLFFVPVLVLVLALVASSCSDDDSDPWNVDEIDYNSSTADAWHNYMKNVAMLLNDDAESLYNAWAVTWKETGKSYAELFKTHDANFTYTNAASCAQEIVEKCAEIANEVGSAKIGDPYNLYISGREKEALYAVESWYSWHSRDDYTNNIYSVRNAYYGSLDGTVAGNSFAKEIEGTAMDIKVRAAIKAAADAIQAIPQPFRNHINSTQVQTAMEACSSLQRLLSEVEEEGGGTVEAEATNLKDYVVNNISSERLDAIVKNYVDVVVVPTYEKLKEKNKLLLDAVNSLVANPTNTRFEAACTAWLNAREPWELSEAFLFGPVDELGLDPNMDSWPLDQNAIVQIMKSADWSSLVWGDDDSDEAIEASQNVRGFHTLEFLLFKDGEARTVPTK